MKSEYVLYHLAKGRFFYKRGPKGQILTGWSVAGAKKYATKAGAWADKASFETDGILPFDVLDIEEAKKYECPF